ncbi:MAG: 50S ribosomal protein L4 [Bacteroidetes bacterium]|jgi:large subunit ribosomal protein L4|nr:50S ribosomal protein L4 [Bacteroidota bacterium]
MEVEILTDDGAASGRSVTLDPTIFEIEPNDHVIWLDVRRIQAHKRQGTAKTKQRSEIRGSTRKLYRQKGTGNARVGDAKSPIRRGGGRAHGPQPRNYRQNLNKKTKRLARRSALTYKAQDEGIFVVEDFDLDTPSTKAVSSMLEALDLTDTKVLIVTGENQPTLYRSARNLPKVSVQEAGSLNTIDVLDAQAVVLQESALDEITRVLSVAQPA